MGASPLTTPGTTYALAQPLAAKRRGGSAFCPKRKIAPATLQGAISTFRILLHSTPGTTYAPAQPLGAERRGGCACGRRAAAGEGASHQPPVSIPLPR